MDSIDEAVQREQIAQDIHKILNTGSRTYQYRRSTPMENRLIDYIIAKLKKEG